ncbi:MAG: leucine-rich repeat protein [Clostridia bacterium]|nr:leucine-rich repeat protein [Clostridia bacterium]
MRMKTWLAPLLLLAVLSVLTGAGAAVEPGVYDSALLINWTDQAFREAFGVEAAAFVPADPQPMTYIVSCGNVIDPRTGRESETNWTYLHRTEPACTEDVLESVSDLSAFSLTLTDDPNRATYLASVSYKYQRDGVFNYTQADARISMYKGVLTVTLKNMVTGQSAKATRDCWCFPESSIEVSVLAEGIGGQFFAGPKPLNSREISAFNDLLGLGIDALYNWEDDEGGGVCITKYLGQTDKGTLQLPEVIHGKPVTGIGKDALSQGYFTGVRLPETLTHIDDRAFASCWYLTGVELPETLTRIGADAFNNGGLKKISVPDSVKELGTGAFSACRDLRSVRLPAGLTEIPDSLLWGSGITAVEIPEGVTRIGKSAFGGCENLKSLRLPESVRVIGDSAFSSCKALGEVVCEGEIELLDHGAFSQCERLSSIRFMKGVKRVGEYAFSSCGKLKSMDLQGLESLGDAAFRWDTGLVSVTLPETLTSIGDLPFGDHGPVGESYANPTGLTLTVGEGSYAHSWAVEEDMKYTAVPPPTEEEKMAVRYPPLARGDRGEGVRALQQALIDMGVLEGAADGSYGPKTAAAVSAAQQAFGMEAYGVASALFQARLYEGK